MDLEVHIPEGDGFSSETGTDSKPDSSSGSSSDSTSSSDGDTDSDGEGDEQESQLSALENDPLMVKLMDRMLEKRGYGKNSNSNSGSSKGKKSKRAKERRRKRAEKLKSSRKGKKKDKKRASGKKPKKLFKTPRNKEPSTTKQIKSPSDTLIFRPALKQKRFGTTVPMGIDTEKVVTVDQLSKILNNFGVAGHKKAKRREETSSSAESVDDEITAKAYADRDIIEAEKLKASIAKPNGESQEFFIAQGCVPPVDYEADRKDMKFFAASCHVEEKSSEKIWFGKFLDLNEIRPDKKRGFKDDDQKMELIHSNGLTYFAPKKDKGKIDGIKRCNEAFRVYAMIYSQANPHRAAEIFQYIDVINSAAASFAWENVAYYDFLFRKLMDENPSRSWAVRCQELWSESMRDPFSRTSAAREGGNSSSTKQKTGNCWRFNSRQGCRKSATACRFEHRCNHCGGTSHGSANCRKRNNNAESSSSHSETKKSKKEKDKRERDSDQQ